MNKHVLLTGLAATVFVLASIGDAAAQDPNEELAKPGTTEGTGTYFEITDSDYVNVSLQSTTSVTLDLESVGSMVTMVVEAVEGGGTTQMSLAGLAPSTTYYMYEDSYSNGGAITTDENGVYTWAQDLATQHLVWLQSGPSTKYISGDATGGDCTTIGNWDLTSRTCTLNTNVYETIEILSDNVTLDGAGHTVKCLYGGNGVYVGHREGVTVKNLTIETCQYGIYVYSGNNIDLTNNMMSGCNVTGFYFVYTSFSSITASTANSCRYDGIALNSSHNNIVAENTANSNYIGFRLAKANNNNTLVNNTAIGNSRAGISTGGAYVGGRYNVITDNLVSNSRFGIHIFWAGNNTVARNTCSNNTYALYLARTSNNEIYNNNFIGNTYPTTTYLTGPNIFNLPAPTGGNYWSEWTSPDSDGDGFVDVPYMFDGGADNLPLTRPYSLNQAPVADAGENIQVNSADQAYTIIQGSATDADSDVLEYRWLEGETVLLDWSPVGSGGQAYLDLALVPYLDIGNHTLTLEVLDGTETATDDVLLTIQNSPPEVQPAPSHQVVQIGIDPIVVVSDVSDFDGDTVAYEWIFNGEVLQSGSTVTNQGGATVRIPDLVLDAGDPRLSLGIHVLEIRVNDSVNPPVIAFVTVEVVDTTAPSLSPLPSITILWPPDHTLQTVTVQANAFDNSGGTIHLDVSVASTEPPDMDGDGNTIPDYYIDSVNNETGVIELRLRSERSGLGEGRTYTVLITATDGSGNQSQAFVNVRAPHDKRLQ